MTPSYVTEGLKQSYWVIFTRYTNETTDNPTDVAVSTAYKVDGDGFLPLLLIQDAGIVAQDVDSSEGIFGFLEGSLRAENNPVRFHISTSPSGSGSQMFIVVSISSIFNKTLIQDNNL